MLILISFSWKQNCNLTYSHEALIIFSHWLFLFTSLRNELGFQDDYVWHIASIRPRTQPLGR